MHSSRHGVGRLEAVSEELAQAIMRVAQVGGGLGGRGEGCEDRVLGGLVGVRGPSTAR